MNTATLIPHRTQKVPSLYAENDPARLEPARAARTFTEMLHDGFYLLLLLRNGYVPSDAGHFLAQIRRLLDDFERDAHRHNALPEDVYAAKYAFCATVDEIILSSALPIRSAWERAPLQLLLFGEQLAGENFYQQLERVRQRGKDSVQALEVFYMCLLVGFQGRYALDGVEKLNYLKSSLDKEIIHLKGKRAQFAPHWKSPDDIRNMLKADIPMWVIGAGLAGVGLAAYAGLSWLLAQHTNELMAGYFNVIKLAPKVANITLSLP